ncbi:hypothetical protein D9613_003686 [Agrocybe pediades]|uniref:F-box domain-containing protein n=1 Tax=Agrocybe pediades TaxID=84607 RepID=A0A8H4QIE6_9AGAR|nr:hypothetical protein D9613_003686 [Agrocybe pediades]
MKALSCADAQGRPGREPLRPDVSKSHLNELPTELILSIFSFLELKPYITSHAVCKLWQRLLPHAEIHPIRRRMLQLYHHMLQAPKFLETRPWLLENLQPFDRQAYIEGLLDQYSDIPEEFQLWVLEWPEKMAVLGIWPGLPLVRFNASTTQTYEGVNWMAYINPLLLALVYNKGSPDIKDNLTPALLIWKTSEHSHWLLFDQDVPELFGRVLLTTYPESPAFYPTLEMYGDDDMPFFVEDFPDWISYLKHRWDAGLKTCPPSYAYANLTDRIKFPVSYQFSSFNGQVLPSPPWTDRQRSGFLEDIRRLLLRLNGGG